MERCKYDVFISYSRKDTKIANKICEVFDKAGIVYFIDRQGIGGGLEFPAVLAKAIRESKIFLFLASKNSYESKFTQSEIVYAFNKKEKQNIIPYIIDGSDLPEELEFTFSAINWRNINDHPIDTVLLKDIKNRLPIDPSPKPPTPQIPPKPRFIFTGKMLGRIILCLSAAYSLFIIISTIASASYLTRFDGWSIILMFILFIFLLVGLIRPKSLDLNTRKEVFKYYLSSFFLFIFAFVIPISEGETDQKNAPHEMIESTVTPAPAEMTAQPQSNDETMGEYNTGKKKR